MSTQSLVSPEALAYVRLTSPAAEEWNPFARDVLGVTTFTADGEVRLATGTLVVCPPNERHWHGAVPGTDTTLLAVTWGTTQWETVAPE